MNGIITKEGFLQVDRKGKFRHQYCPFTRPVNGEVVLCSDGCPMFGEPELFSGYTVPVVNLYCGKGSVIAITKDERE